jgi:hypothetical protein
MPGRQRDLDIDCSVAGRVCERQIANGFRETGGVNRQPVRRVRCDLDRVTAVEIRRRCELHGVAGVHHDRGARNRNASARHAAGDAAPRCGGLRRLCAGGHAERGHTDKERERFRGALG